MSKSIITWQSLEEKINSLSKCILPNIKSIYGLPRGGLIPAVMLSHKTGIPLTNNPKQGETLIIDDVYETGKTLKPYSQFNCMVLYSKKIIPNLQIGEISNKWIQFPWETEQSSKVDYLEK